MSSNVFGIVLILIGVIYLIKPTIFRRWFWKETSITQRNMTPKNYIIYMRILGIVFIAIGICQLLRYYDYL